eukprot:TRINITY_DN3499_c0_g1_i2.p1 TRINITY_DN3499_c0_g1~~TRINITY_DN3499_c0_g1_i2.p1  ORF type:complete len:270 (+),score=59.52 TRINITY_DN3499_c0_g1_i2:169-978(+)
MCIRDRQQAMPTLVQFSALSLFATLASATIELDSDGLPLTPALPATLMVYTTRDGLPWPLPDLASTDAIMIHALHCLQVSQAPLAPGTNNSDSNVRMEAMHQRHCAKHSKLVHQFLDKNELNMPLQVCRLLLPSGNFGRTNLEAQLGESCCAPWSNQIFRSNGGATKNDLMLPQGLFDLQIPFNMTVHHRAWLASYNFGSLLIKVHKGTATDVERLWMEKWSNELNVARGAMAYDCYHSHPQIQTAFQCLYDGVVCADESGQWDMSKQL